MTYTISSSHDSIEEGKTFTITINAKDFDPNEILYWTIKGSDLDHTDIVIPMSTASRWDSDGTYIVYGSDKIGNDGSINFLNSSNVDKFCDAI